MDELRRSPFASDLAQRLERAVDAWQVHLPMSLRDAFRDTFVRFGTDHEQALDVIEHLWERRHRSDAVDDCTGLTGRRAFREHLQGLLGSPDRRFAAIGLIFLDLDNFKAINDRYGHETGDLALRAVGRIIRDGIRVEREIDFMAREPASLEPHAVSRHGGDEFLVAVVLQEPAEINRISSRLKMRVDDSSLQRAYGFHGQLPLTVSVGGVVLDHPSAISASEADGLVRDLIAAADEQMCAAKRDGRVHIMQRTSGDVQITSFEAPWPHHAA